LTLLHVGNIGSEELGDSIGGMARLDYLYQRYFFLELNRTAANNARRAIAMSAGRGTDDALEGTGAHIRGGNVNSGGVIRSTTDAAADGTGAFSRRRVLTKTAVCIVGEARGFGDSQVHRSLVGQVKSLAPSGSVPPDVFLYISLSVASLPQHCVGRRGKEAAQFGCGVKTDSNISDQQLGLAISHLQPVAVDIADRHGPQAVPSRSCPSGSGPICERGTEFGCTFWSQFEKVGRCWRMVQDYEREHGMRYDYIGRLRPDVRLEAEFPRISAHQLRTANRLELFHRVWGVKTPLGTTVGDHFALMRRVDAPTYFEASRAFYQCVPLGMLQVGCHVDIMHGRAVPPECILTHWLRVVNRVVLIEKEFLQLSNFTLVRSDGSKKMLDYLLF